MIWTNLKKRFYYYIDDNKEIQHSSKIRHLCSMKRPTDTLQNLAYFQSTTMFFFFFFVLPTTLFFPLLYKRRS